jgi:two-component system, NarL family, sensor histidine kinase DevS
MRNEARYSPDAVIGAFGHVASAIAAGGRRDAVLNLIASSVRELVDGDLAGVALRLPDGRVQTVVADGVDADFHRGEIYEADRSFADRVLRTGQPLVVDNLSEVPAAGRAVPGCNLGPSAFVPIRVNGPYGVLSVCRLVGRESFTDTDLDVIACFAAQSALVIENDCRRRRANALQRISDQARIAEELHDTAISEIFSASLTLSQLVNQTTDDERELAVHTIGSLDNAIKLIRQAIFGLNESRLGSNESEDQFG